MDEGIRPESGQIGNGTWVRIPASPLRPGEGNWQTWLSQKELLAGSTPAPGTMAGYPAGKRHVAQQADAPDSDSGRLSGMRVQCLRSASVPAGQASPGRLAPRHVDEKTRKESTQCQRLI